MIGLYILRHGVAASREEWAPKRESQRPLTSKGEKQMRRISRAMRKLELSFDLILSSPFLRARQTAAIVADTFDAKEKLKLSDALAPGSNPRRFIEEARHLFGASRQILVVGHEPFLSALISLLVRGDAHVGLKLKKAGLCKLELNALKPGAAILEWLLAPRHLLKG